MGNPSLFVDVVMSLLTNTQRDDKDNTHRVPDLHEAFTLHVGAHPLECPRGGVTNEGPRHGRVTLHEEGGIFQQQWRLGQTLLLQLLYLQLQDAINRVVDKAYTSSSQKVK